MNLKSGGIGSIDTYLPRVLDLLSSPPLRVPHIHTPSRSSTRPLPSILSHFGHTSTASDTHSRHSTPTAKMLKIWSMKQQQQKSEAAAGGAKKKKVTAAQLRVQKGQ